MLSLYCNNPGFKPKIVNYIPNGKGIIFMTKGRDGYIFEDNGGFKRKAMTVKFQKDQFHLNQSVIKYNRNALDIPLIHHISDGTGRDQYIQYDHGGLCKSPNYKAHVFINDLRKSEKQIQILNSDFYLKSQYRMSKKSEFKNKETLISQSNLIERLYTNQTKSQQIILPKLK